MIELSPTNPVFMIVDTACDAAVLGDGVGIGIELRMGVGVGIEVGAEYVHAARLRQVSV